MCSESRRLDEQIKSLQAQLKTFPDGDFYCNKNGNRYKWFHIINGVKQYLKKSDHSLAEQLAIKKYLSLQLEDLLHEKTAIDFYLRHHVPAKAEQLLTQNSEYQKLLSPHFKPLSQELENWSISGREATHFKSKRGKFQQNSKFATRFTEKDPNTLVLGSCQCNYINVNAI